MQAGGKISCMLDWRVSDAGTLINRHETQCNNFSVRFDLIFLMEAQH